MENSAFIISQAFQKKGLLPIEWANSVDFPSAGMLAAKAGGLGRGPGGASRPGQDIMRQWIFHRFASENTSVGPI